jgi:KUP system potassium uptake protein
VYSLTQQAVQLGYLPRLKIIHTNPDVRGQIYMPQVNYLLMISCLALVFHFSPPPISPPPTASPWRST